MENTITDLTEDDDPFDINPANAERMLTETIEGWQARKQPTNPPQSFRSASSAQQQTSQNGYHQPSTFRKMPSPKSSAELQLHLPPGTAGSAVQVKQVGSPLANDEIFGTKAPTPASHRSFNQQNVTPSLNLSRRAAPDLGPVSSLWCATAPGQREPYSLPPDCTQCPIPNCWNRLSYKDQPDRLSGHMSRVHGWPLIGQGTQSETLQMNAPGRSTNGSKEADLARSLLTSSNWDKSTKSGGETMFI